MFNGFSDKYLKNWFNLVFIIKEIRILIPNLSLLWVTSSIWNQNCLWWSINVIIWFNFHFVYHIVMITKLLPSVSALHLLHLHILLVFLHLLLSKLIFLSSSSNFILSLSHVSFFHLLFFNKGWIRLHIDRNNQSCESVTSHNSTIVHQVLWSDLNILSVGITVPLLTNDLWFGGEALSTDATTIVLH